MKVKELIEELKKLDQQKEIYFLDTELWYSAPIKKIKENMIIKYRRAGGSLLRNSVADDNDINYLKANWYSIEEIKHTYLMVSL